MSTRARMFLASGGILLVAFLIAWALARRFEATPLSYVPSSFNASPAGTKALWATLQKLGFSVQRWQHPWTRLVREKGVLIHTDAVFDELLAQGNQGAPLREEYAQLGRWVDRGNTVVVYTSPDAIWPFSPERLSEEPEAVAWREPSARRTAARKEPRFSASPSPYDLLLKQKPDIVLRTPLPSSYTHGVKEVVIGESQGLKPAGGAVVPLIEGADEALHAFWIPRGKGRVIVFSTPSFINNEYCGREDNLVLILNILSRLPAGGTVFFDEYHHGYSQEFALGDFLSLPMVKVAGLQLVLVVGLLICSSARRFGEPIPLVRDTRRSVMEYTVSLGDLYARASTQLDALDYLYRHLRRFLTERYGLRSDASALEIRSALGTTKELRLAWEQLAGECEQRLESRQLTRRQFVLLARQIQQLRSHL